MMVSACSYLRFCSISLPIHTFAFHSLQSSQFKELFVLTQSFTSQFSEFTVLPQSLTSQFIAFTVMTASLASQFS